MTSVAPNNQTLVRLGIKVAMPFFVTALVVGCAAATTSEDTEPTQELTAEATEAGDMDDGGMEGMDMPSDLATIPAGVAYAEGETVYFAHTEASDAEVAELLSGMMDSPVLHVPSLAQAPDEMLADVYVFTNGIEGMGPLGFQPDVFGDLPGSETYTPLRRLVKVTWVETATPRELKSVAEVQEAEANGEVMLERTDVVINMPFVQWPGGSR